MSVEGGAERAWVVAGVGRAWEAAEKGQVAAKGVGVRGRGAGERVREAVETVMEAAARGRGAEVTAMVERGGRVQVAGAALG